ncbi:similar to Saccharomyces cerevisiae YDR004W RAD57 Protein that stimulates strand exchange by stabilizing the binding of Rad51p to single-stranded DNA [Maudiozyma barnettii]|uniref:Similar to Saccharomyces cerevisiae YDR004W RAD57 Protein that stimulates strand exchange by stabilizing the binding of Rad51p to single-stranded DNA n=1 Tax=Maudiozyma barnettii TaxID=61262 RepID=A0A8H2ZGC1_9SACH|nr:putative DNA-dependent ATPase RAD57 [Kazachstania barnettii]CAB4253159.1 similar to Saccharomyces cerevisiae YDR004W RAD57 Protein that stimulates strand exchange by stabilizing the binding of Rad51p to single-stranded DNA [Kazachstania barnettii]CAD1780305.1 similar to Saccharomyces cerevisiae YDR004W RAD57 Protein that stimulates strand exchange by stabilizing the binding of Rad51p to single-stranded DNA [Kazachstania barnettii]
MDLYDELPASALLCDPEFTALFEACQRYRITTIDFLTLNVRELAKISQRSINEVVKVKRLLLNEFDKQFVEKDKIQSVKEVEPPQVFTSGDMEIDSLLGGGIHTKSITEIFGESSTGKSQLLMQLCLNVQLPIAKGGLEGKCVYITTEGDLPTPRLNGILDSRPDWKSIGVSQANIFTVSCFDLISQEHILNVQLPVLLERNKGQIKLIIIDSISHHMRVELETKSFSESQDNRYYVDKMAENLLQLAKKHSTAVVVANQVGDKPLVDRPDDFVHHFMDYDYQLGWLVGWRDSTIMYRQYYTDDNSKNKSIRNHQQSQRLTQSTTLDSNSTVEDLLSDDEDYSLIEREINKVINSQSTSQENNDLPNNPTSTTKRSQTVNSNRFVPRKKKRRLDIRVPNLGLSWANHVTTRLLLKKSYKASPMIKRGEVKFYQGVDPASFWQVKRTLQLVYSTFAKPGEVSFVITKKGIEST